MDFPERTLLMAPYMRGCRSYKGREVAKGGAFTKRTAAGALKLAVCMLFRRWHVQIMKNTDVAPLLALVLRLG